MENANNYDAFKQLCSVHGLKCTPQRFAVYEYMRDNVSHPTVEQIWSDVKKIAPTITRESVFRILNELAKMGVVYRMDKIINARFDGRSHSHGHMICEQCGTVIDFELPKDLKLDAGDVDFQTNHVEIRLNGLCSKCRQKARDVDASISQE